MRRAVLDIETVPLEIEAELTAEDSKKRSLDAMAGRVACVGVISIDDCTANSAVAMCSTNEKQLLSDVWGYFKEERVSRFVTHNGLSFDLPFLWKRSIINRVKPTVALDLKKYRSDFVYDTMNVWSNWEPRQFVTLDALSRVLGVGEKSGSGSEVLDLWRTREFETIARYCLDDCWLTYACYCRMNFVEPNPRDGLPVDLRVASPTLVG